MALTWAEIDWTVEARHGDHDQSTHGNREGGSAEKAEKVGSKDHPAYVAAQSTLTESFPNADVRIWLQTSGQIEIDGKWSEVRGTEVIEPAQLTAISTRMSELADAFPTVARDVDSITIRQQTAEESLLRGSTVGWVEKTSPDLTINSAFVNAQGEGRLRESQQSGWTQGDGLPSLIAHEYGHLFARTYHGEVTEFVERLRAQDYFLPPTEYAAVPRSQGGDAELFGELFALAYETPRDQMSETVAATADWLVQFRAGAPGVRQVRHGEHDQSTHGNRDGVGRAEESPSGLAKDASVADVETYLGKTLPNATIDLTYNPTPEERTRQGLLYPAMHADPALVRQVADGVARVAADLPASVLERVKVVEVVPLPEGIYARWHQGEAIQISAVHMQTSAIMERKYEEDIATGYHVAGTNFETGIVGHEMGHVLHDAVREGAPNLLVDLFGELFSQPSKTGVVDAATLDSWTKARWPSEYAHRNDNEHFGEMYAAHLAGTDWPGAPIFDKYLDLMKGQLEANAAGRGWTTEGWSAEDQLRYPAKRHGDHDQSTHGNRGGGEGKASTDTTRHRYKSQAEVEEALRAVLSPGVPIDLTLTVGDVRAIGYDVPDGTDFTTDVPALSQVASAVEAAIERYPALADVITAVKVVPPDPTGGLLGGLHTAALAGVSPATGEFKLNHAWLNNSWFKDESGSVVDRAIEAYSTDGTFHPAGSPNPGWPEVIQHEMGHFMDLVLQRNGVSVEDAYERMLDSFGPGAYPSEYGKEGAPGAEAQIAHEWFGEVVSARDNDMTYPAKAAMEERFKEWEPLLTNPVPATPDEDFWESAEQLAEDANQYDRLGLGRQVRHGDHDQSTHGNRDGESAGGESKAEKGGGKAAGGEKVGRNHPAVTQAKADLSAAFPNARVSIFPEDSVVTFENGEAVPSVSTVERAQLEEVTGQLVGLAKEYPAVAERMSSIMVTAPGQGNDSHDDRALAWVPIDSTDELVINRNHLNATGEARIEEAQKKGWLVGKPGDESTAWESVVTHEYGHLFHATNEAATFAFIDRVKSLDPRRSGSPSGYATWALDEGLETADSELFGELFAAVQEVPRDQWTPAIRATDEFLSRYRGTEAAPTFGLKKVAFPEVRHETENNPDHSHDPRGGASLSAGEGISSEEARQRTEAVLPPNTRVFLKGDAVMVERATKGIERVAADLPRVVLDRADVITILDHMSTPNAYAQWGRRNRSIEINTAWMDSRREFDESWARGQATGWNPAGTDFATGVIGHEYGHVLADFVLEAAAPEAVKNAVRDLDNEMQALGEIDPKMGWRNRATPSEYGNTNNQEWFGEAYAAHLAGTDWVGAPVFEKFYDRVKAALAEPAARQVRHGDHDQSTHGNRDGTAVADAPTGHAETHVLDDRGRVAVNSYVDFTHNTLNTHLRHRDDPNYTADAEFAAHVAEEIAAIDANMRPLSEETELYRGVPYAAFGFDPYDEGNPYGTLVPELDAANHIQGMVGAVIQDKAYLSTTSDPTLDLYTGADIQMIITAPEGTPAINAAQTMRGQLMEEQEMLLGHGLNLRIDAAEFIEDESLAAASRLNVYGDVRVYVTVLP